MARVRMALRLSACTNILSRVPLTCLLLLVATMPGAANADGGPAAPAAPADDPVSVYANWQTFTTEDGLPDNRIRVIHVSGQRVWVGTDGGLALREGDTWRSWTRREGLPWPAVTAIDVDTRTQEVWLGTWGGGLIRFSAGRFDRFDQRNSGLAGDLVLAVVVRDGRVWSATNGGVSAFDPLAGTWALHFERRADEPQRAVVDLCLDPGQAGGLFAGLWCGGVRRFDSRRGTWLELPQVGPSALSTQPSPSPTRSTRAGPSIPSTQPSPSPIRSTRAGPSSARSAWRTQGLPADDRAEGDVTLALTAGGQSLWWLTTDRLLRRDGAGTWHARPTGKPITREDLAYCLAAANDAEVWLGTDHGLRSLTDGVTGTWVTYTRDASGPGGVVTVSRDARRLGARTLTSSIPDNRVRCVAFQGAAVWVGTANGLALASGRTHWNDLRPATRPQPPIAGAPRRRVAPTTPAPSPPKKARPRRRAAPIAALAPMTKLMFLPGADSARTGAVADRLAVQLAVKQANDRGGYRDEAPFLLASNPKGYERYGWGMPEDDFPAYAYEDEVLGFVGYVAPDSPITSVVALRTEVPVVNAARERATLDERINPWIFRCNANDPRQHEMLLDYVFQRLGRTRMAVLRSLGGRAQVHLDWWSRHARRRGHPPVADLFFNPDARNLEPQLRELRQAQPHVVVTWADARMSAAMLRLLREAGLTPLFVGSDLIVRDEFVRLAGEQPGTVIAIAPCAHRRDAEAAARFTETYRQQHSPARARRRPRLEAYFAFDAANHLMEAVHTAGPDRQAIRDTLDRMSDAVFARLEHGEWKIYNRADLLPSPE